MIDNAQTETGIAVEQKESIKLIKNSRGYSWEIRILEPNVERLAELDKQMADRWGQGGVEE